MLEAKAIFVVYTDVDPSDEADFNIWYDTKHRPDFMALEGVVAMQRYKLCAGGQEVRRLDGEISKPRFLTLYHLDSTDTDAFAQRAAKAREGWLAEGRLFSKYHSFQTAVYEHLTTHNAKDL